MHSSILGYIFITVAILSAIIIIRGYLRYASKGIAFNDGLYWSFWLIGIIGAYLFK